jgi:DNA-binding NtrC family response regulator
VLSDPYISKHHCTLMKAADGIWIQDEKSRNGTWVANMRVDRCRVTSGSQIVVGRTGLELIGEKQSASPFGIIGEHPKIKQVVSRIERFGPTSKPVLIQGETGTGKELVARALHEHSPCRLARFVPLNCAAIPRDLAETELFGHAAGAFTGASRERKGAFELADGGTLFLDEVGEMPVGEMPLELQPKLLRVLEEGKVQRIGEEDRRRVKARLVAGTHRDLLHETKRKRFRLDLFHRLAVGLIRLPPLRDRPEDIPLLVSHFLQQEVTDGTPITLAPDVIRFLAGEPWRGNVRALRNVVQRAVIEFGNNLTVKHFRAAILEEEGTCCMEGYICVTKRPFEEMEREIYSHNLEAHGGNCAAAAASLKIPKSTFWDRVRAMKLK